MQKIYKVSFTNHTVHVLFCIIFVLFVGGKASIKSSQTKDCKLTVVAPLFNVRKLTFKVISTKY